MYWWEIFTFTHSCTHAWVHAHTCISTKDRHCSIWLYLDTISQMEKQIYRVGWNQFVNSFPDWMFYKHFYIKQPHVLYVCLVDLLNMLKQREKMTDHTSVVLTSLPPMITSPGPLLQMSWSSAFRLHNKTANALLITPSRHVLCPQCALFFPS